MDLGTVRARLLDGSYARAEQFASDVRLVFSNSRLYNTNKRSRVRAHWYERASSWFNYMEFQRLSGSARGLMVIHFISSCFKKHTKPLVPAVI